MCLGNTLLVSHSRVETLTKKKRKKNLIFIKKKFSCGPKKTYRVIACLDHSCRQVADQPVEVRRARVFLKKSYDPIPAAVLLYSSFVSRPEDRLDARV